MSSQEELNDKLFEAVDAGNQEEVGRLIAAGAKVNAQPRSVREVISPRPEDWPIETPLIYAICNEDASMVGLLLALGADPESYIDGDVNSALELAVESNSLEIVKLLLDYGANVNRGIFLNGLMIAYHDGHREVFDYLLGRGADPAAKTSAGDNFYEYASNLGRELWLEPPASLKSASGKNGQRTSVLLLTLLIAAIVLRGCNLLSLSAIR